MAARPAAAPPARPLPRRPTTVERAFELAQTGECRGVAEIAEALKRERHEAVDAHLAGPSIRRDLKRTWEAAAASDGAAEARAPRACS